MSPTGRVPATSIRRLSHVGLVLVITVIAVIGRTSHFPDGERAFAVVGPPLPLGTVTPTASLPRDCPLGSTCAGFRVVCPGVAEARTAYTSTRAASGTARGMVVFFSGDVGTRWWALEPGSDAFLGRLRALGFVTIQVRWASGWSIAAGGEDAGSGHLACRPASMIRWIHDHRYLPLNVPAGTTGQCGFCITGNSGGASQVAYALSFYGLDSILDGVFPTSGPPHTAQDRGCLRRPGEGRFFYGANSIVIDQAHGFLTGGPCRNANANFLLRWLAESVDTGGRDFFHPGTTVHFIHSDADVPAVPHAIEYVGRLRSAGTPYLTEQVIVGMPHRLQSSAAGLDALLRAIVGSVRK